MFGSNKAEKLQNNYKNKKNHNITNKSRSFDDDEVRSNLSPNHISYGMNKSESPVNISGKGKNDQGDGHINQDQQILHGIGFN